MHPSRTGACAGDTELGSEALGSGFLDAGTLSPSLGWRRDAARATERCYAGVLLAERIRRRGKAGGTNTHFTHHLPVADRSSVTATTLRRQGRDRQAKKPWAGVAAGNRFARRRLTVGSWLRSTK